MMKMDKKGDTISGHAHTYDHITLLSSGKVSMKHDKGENFFSAPKLIVTPKGIKHEFKALTDDVVLCCIHAIRDGDGVDDVASPDITVQEAHDLLTDYPLLEKETN